MPFHDLDSALDYLYRFTNYESMGRFSYTRTNFDLERVRQMLEWCGNPDRRIATLVHVAGTKGKGSTCAFVEAVLRSAGQRTGLYTSPHLEDIRERIQVNGAMISPESLRDHISALRDYLEQPREGLAPTFFDIITTIGFREFAQQACQTGVIEVGLGGRLDSTNVIRPTVAAVTFVHYDHTDKLGTQLCQIAAEKAGILKAGIPAVIGYQLDEAAEVIRKRIQELGIPAWWLGKDIRIENEGTGTGTFDVATPARRHPGLRLRMLGRHQRQNAAVALGVCDWLAETAGIPVTESAVRDAACSLSIPGRIEVFGARPRIVLDGAHNASSAMALAETLRESFKHQKLFLVLGIAADKAVDEVLGILVPLASQVFATAISNPRATRPDDLAKRIRAVATCPVAQVDDPLAALNQAREAAGADDLVVIAGSFYLAGELRPALREMLA
jgi:dihydrofolate synthase/folylpolyglutamate synthase